MLEFYYHWILLSMSHEMMTEMSLLIVINQILTFTLMHNKDWMFEHIELLKDMHIIKGVAEMFGKF